MKLICCLLWIFFCLHLNFSVGQEINRNRLDSLFSGLEQNNKFMGSVSVFRDGKEVYAKAVGFRDVEKKILADVHTQYRIGSITKTFTTVLIMKAVEKGKLSLDDKLSKWFPQIGNADDITIR
jgi:D-alanyl-D-alanine carboxypeptidase